MDRRPSFFATRRIAASEGSSSTELPAQQGVQRQAARQVGVSHGTVANWFKEYADALPDDLPGPEGQAEVAEQDELFTFIGHKKTKPMS